MWSDVEMPIVMTIMTYSIAAYRTYTINITMMLKSLRYESQICRIIYAKMCLRCIMNKIQSFNKFYFIADNKTANRYEE